MRKFELGDWASVAEIIGTIAVVISLLFVAQSLDRNTAAISSESTDDVLGALREVELSVISNPDLLHIVVKGRDNVESLSALEREAYARYVVIYLDEWDKLDARERLGLLRTENLEGWHPYFEAWLKEHVTPEMWGEIKWNYGDSNISERIEAVLSE